MSTIIELIITFVLYFLIGLIAALPIAIFYTRKMDKLISTYFHKIDESFAALDKSLDEGRAQGDEIHQSFDEISESADEMHEDIDEMHEDIGEINESLDRISESFDRMDESMDRLVESRRLLRDYSNYKIKMIEARENFREPEFWNEKNIH